MLDRAGDRFVALAPVRIRPGLNLYVRRRTYRRFVRQRLGRRALRPLLQAPIPPPSLVAQTSVMREDQLADAANANGYLSGAYLGAWVTLSSAERAQKPLAEIRSMLDFGCGAGKNLRVWREIDQLALSGCDINAAQIAWAHAHLAGFGIEFATTRPDPPLPYPSDSFDLVNAASVFTHIPLVLQDEWLEELRRILRPGGILIATVAGEFHAHAQLTPEQLGELSAGGHVVLEPGAPGASHASNLTSQLDVFQSEAEVRDVFGRHLELRAYERVESGQDVVSAAKA